MTIGIIISEETIKSQTGALTPPKITIIKVAINGIVPPKNELPTL